MTGLVYITYNVISISFVYAHFIDDWVQAVFASESVGMDAPRAAQLLESLRTQITLPRIVLNNLTIFAVSGTFLSLLISVAFIGRFRRAPRETVERV